MLAAAGLAALLLAAPAARAAEHAVEIHLRLDERPHGSRAERERLRELEYALMDRLAGSGAGRFVRDEWRDGTCVLHLAGPDARALWAAVEAPVRAASPRPGSWVALRGGGAPEERIPLGGPPVTPPR